MTAEAALVIPVLLAVTAALVWLLALGVAQVRLVDAAREAARALARDEARATALGLGRRVAPDGARFSVRRGEGTVRVRVRVEVSAPGPLLEQLGGVELDATAVAATEPVGTAP